MEGVPAPQRPRAADRLLLALLWLAAAISYAVVFAPP
jgi:hypothetical protein